MRTKVKVSQKIGNGQYISTSVNASDYLIGSGIIVGTKCSFRIVIFFIKYILLMPFWVIYFFFIFPIKKIISYMIAKGKELDNN